MTEMNDSSKRINSTLWDYAVNKYQKQEFIFLKLQDTSQLDVNRLLFCGWLTSHGKQFQNEINTDDLLNDYVSWYDNVIQPLRAIRRHVKTAENGPLYKQSLELELHVERHGLDILEALSPQTISSSEPWKDLLMINLAVVFNNKLDLVNGIIISNIMKILR